MASTSSALNISRLTMQNLNEIVQQIGSQNTPFASQLATLLRAYQENFDLLARGLKQVSGGVSATPGNGIPLMTSLTNVTISGSSITSVDLSQSPVNGQLLIVNGGVLEQGTDAQTGDYTISGSRITFNALSQPVTGSKILCLVW